MLRPFSNRTVLKTVLSLNLCLLAYSCWVPLSFRRAIIRPKCQKRKRQHDTPTKNKSLCLNFPIYLVATIDTFLSTKRALKPPVDTNFCSFNIIKIIHPRRTQTCFKSRLNVHNPLRSSLATVSVMYIELFLFHSVINTSYVCSDMVSK